MPIFQKSVIKDHIANLSDEKIDAAFAKFQENYSTQKITEIKNLKEEEYQAGFLRDIFVDVFGYTLKPEENFNLAMEFKNQADSKKADGAILKDGKAVVVIELKSTKTKDLKTITEQAFNYKNNQPGCKYVVTSNFQKLRFYVDYANEYEEFDLFNIEKEDFKLLYLILHKENIFADLPLKLKEETKFHEEKISDKFYKDYSQFKHKIYNNLVKNNKQYDELTLFKKSQKFLDRLLFIYFAEDVGLVPANAISRIIDQWEKLKELDAYTPLYKRFVQFFNHIDKGHKYEAYELPAYNGGLFAPDKILDDITIDDEILKDDALKLSAYDFNTEVDVNILGHIFEHSLSEIEEITAELEGAESDKSKSKRKKDGIFYTPKYITQYIVENTVGKLCTEKRKELNIIEIEFDSSFRGKNGKLSAKGQNLFDKLNNYKNWLLTLKIIDPACGSGAFLNQALNFLIEEHKTIDDIIAELTGDLMGLFTTDKEILESNLYGVDINEESVEIAKLSLWLRTAQKGRKLSSLNNNIKCGNSLIDDPEVAGDKAFNWNKEFPEIMENGGFDVVIGNPPYVDIKALPHKLVKGLFKYYDTTENRINLYSIFIEKARSIVKDKGFVSFINPNSILVNSSYRKIRRLLMSEMTKIIKLPDNVFIDAKVETIIFEYRKNYSTEIVDVIVYPKSEVISFVDNLRIKKINKKIWKTDENNNYNIFLSTEHSNLLEKIRNQSTNELGDISDFSLGITPYDKYKGHSQDIIKNKKFHSSIKVDETYKPLITGENILRFYVTNTVNGYIKYGDWLGAMRLERFFTEPRIIVRQIISGKPPRIYAGFSDEDLYFTQIGFSVIPKNNLSIKFILALLNSRLLTYFHKYSYLDIEKELFQKILIANCKQLPIKEINKEGYVFFNEKVDKIINLNKKSQQKKTKFINRLTDNFEIEKLSKKLDKFYDFDFKTLVAELKKKKIAISLNEQDEWEDYFTAYKTEINTIQAEISKTDKEIDQMVYELYELTDEEVEIVENS